MQMQDVDFFGDTARFHHVGMVVKRIEGQVSPDPEIFEDPVQKVKVAFVRIHGVAVELIEPLGEDSPVARNLASGQKLVHLCFEAPDLDAAMRAGRAHGFHTIRRPVPAVAFDGRKIAWLFSREHGLVELVEAEANGA